MVQTKPEGGGLSEAELAELYRKTGALVLRRCRFLLRDPAEAEDVMHDVFIRAMRYGSSLRQANVPLAWLYRTAERCCFDRMKRRTRESVSDDENLAETIYFPSGQKKFEAADIVEKYFLRLEPRLQQVALLHYVDGLTQEQIAEQMQWSRRTVGKKMKMLRRAAQRLAARTGGAR